jgi:hypothetical protein
MAREQQLSPQLILRLQTTSGNRAVQRVLQRRAALRAAQKSDEAGRGHGPRNISAEAPDPVASRWRWIPRLLRRGSRPDENN